VYFLTLDELVEAVATGEVDLETVHRRAAAQRELEQYQEPLIVVAGEVPPVEQWPRRSADAPTARTADLVLDGAASSPGRATGRARVVRDAYSDEPPRPGEVLVAPITDPGWMPLFIGVVAVVTEMGGELSHTMIVARDLGIPAVVGAVGATTAIATGDLISVDGSAGIVRVLERA
jgi:pyruvate,water dikinase